MRDWFPANIAILKNMPYILQKMIYRYLQLIFRQEKTTKLQILA